MVRVTFRRRTLANRRQPDHFRVAASTQLQPRSAQDVEVDGSAEQQPDLPIQREIGRVIEVMCSASRQQSRSPYAKVETIWAPEPASVDCTEAVVDRHTEVSPGSEGLFGEESNRDRITPMDAPGDRRRDMKDARGLERLIEVAGNRAIERYRDNVVGRGRISRCVP